MKNKGFVVSAVLYPLLVLFLALIMGLLAMSDTRKRILDKMKLEISDSIFDEATCSCDTILNKLNYLIKNGVSGGGGGSYSQNSLTLNVKEYETPANLPNIGNSIGDIAVITDIEIPNYYVGPNPPKQPKEGTVWIVQDRNSSYFILSDNSKIGVSYVMQYVDENWEIKVSYVYSEGVWEKLYYVDLNDSYFYEGNEYIYDFDYTGTIQTFTAPFAGTYVLETWGAQGGFAASSGYYGGYGSYATGVVYLNAGENLYIVVGGQGSNDTSLSATASGGYNGGGDGSNRSDVYVAAGGGATHISTKKGILSSLSDDKDSILIVASGGGGGGYHNASRYAVGGHGGGIIGVSGSVVESGGCGSYGVGGQQGPSDLAVLPTRLFGYTLGLYETPQILPGFGKGGTGVQVASTGGSGGGGGWYGGGGGACISGGGGGSSYIASKRLISFGGITKHMVCYNCLTSVIESTYTKSTTLVNKNAISGNAKLGNGYARIKLQTLQIMPNNEANEEDTYIFTSHETSEKFEATRDGYYKLEVWGAQGGGADGSTSYSGGFGGYAVGVVYLQKGSTIYVTVGGHGESGTVLSRTSRGGYNGGGIGYKRNDVYMSGGGGATHIATEKGVLSSLSNKKESILIVAGGGGGSSYYTTSRFGKGGSGGGFEGVNGSVFASSNCDSYGIKGTQSTAGGCSIASGGSGLCSQNIGSFGRGGSSTESPGGSGGGGGYYGGGGAGCVSAGGGGSGYIASTKLLSYNNITKHMTCYSCSQSSIENIFTISTNYVSIYPIADYAKIGDGYAIITYIGE